MNNERKNMLSVVLFWALGEGMSVEASEVSSDVLVAEKRGRKIAFITEFDRSKDELFECIAKNKSDFIYVVTNDNAKRRELLKVIPDYCGILCHGNPFGLGMITQILKEPILLEVR